MTSLRYKREKESIRQYSLNNQEKIKEYKRQWGLKKREAVIKKPVTREDQLARMRQWRIDNHEKFVNARNKWAMENPNKIAKSKARHVLTKVLGCTSQDVPIDLLDAFTSVSIVKRKVKELSK